MTFEWGIMKRTSWLVLVYGTLLSVSACGTSSGTAQAPPLASPSSSTTGTVVPPPTGSPTAVASEAPVGRAGRVIFTDSDGFKVQVDYDMSLPKWTAATLNSKPGLASLVAKDPVSISIENASPGRNNPANFIAHVEALYAKTSPACKSEHALNVGVVPSGLSGEHCSITLGSSVRRSAAALAPGGYENMQSGFKGTDMSLGDIPETDVTSVVDALSKPAGVFLSLTGTTSGAALKAEKSCALQVGSGSQWDAAEIVWQVKVCP